MPKAPKTYHFSVETAETYVSPTSLKKHEEAYLRMRGEVEELIEQLKHLIEIYDLDGLIEPSQTSRRARSYEKNEEPQPPRPLNAFFAFRKNCEEKIRRENGDTRVKVVSKKASAEWEKWSEGESPEVTILFEKIADLAKKYYKYKYPNYKFQPNRGNSQTTLSSPESLKSYFSSPDMSLSNPESSSTSTSSSPSLISVNSHSTENASRDFDIFENNGSDLTTLGFSVPESLEFIQRPITSDFQDLTNLSSSFPVLKSLEAVQQQQNSELDLMDYPSSFSASEPLEVNEQDLTYSLSSFSAPQSSEASDFSTYGL